jgi:hypothetical protein
LDPPPPVVVINAKDFHAPLRTTASDLLTVNRGVDGIGSRRQRMTLPPVS